MVCCLFCCYLSQIENEVFERLRAMCQTLIDFELMRLRSSDASHSIQRSFEQALLRFAPNIFFLDFLFHFNYICFFFICLMCYRIDEAKLFENKSPLSDKTAAYAPLTEAELCLVDFQSFKDKCPLTLATLHEFYQLMCDEVSQLKRQKQLEDRESAQKIVRVCHHLFSPLQVIIISAIIWNENIRRR